MAWPRIGIIPTWGHLHPLREGVANEPHHWMNREDQKNERLRDPPATARPWGAGCAVFRAKAIRDPFLLMLFMKDGYAYFLEGTIIGTNSTVIDLAPLRFKIEPG
jgi:hypothetical protein